MNVFDRAAGNVEKKKKRISSKTTLKRNSQKRERKETYIFYAFISPFIIGFSVFTIFPMVMSLIFSVNKISILDYAQGYWDFIGFDNYKSILFGDNYFFIAMKNTFIFAFLRVFICVFVSLLVAVLLNSKIPGRKIFRTLIYIPAIVPVVGSSVLWRQLFDGRSSILSYFLNMIGIKVDPTLWLGQYGLYSAVFMSVIMGIGPTMIMILAALQGVPQEMQEAAQIDGAGALRRFWYITVPFISSILFFVSITGFISCLQAYAEVDLLVGSMSNSSMTLSMLAMNYYRDPRIGLGYSSAISWLIFFIVMIFTIIYFAVAGKKVFYAGD